MAAAIPERGPLRTLTKSTLANTIGNGLFFTVEVIFFTRSVGLSTHQVALGLAIAAAAGLLVSVPAGHLADRWGPRELTAAMCAGEGVVMASFVLVHTFGDFVLVSVLGALVGNAGASTRGAMMSRFGVGEERVRVRAFQRAVTNFGISIGVLFSGVALAYDTRDAYLTMVLGDAVTFFVAAYYIMRLPAMAPVEHEAGTRREPMTVVLRDHRYLLASGLNGLFWIHFAVQSVGLPLWIVDHTYAPRWWVSVLLIINTTMVILFQVRFSRGSGDVTTAARAFRRSGVLIGVGFLCYSAAQGASAWAACAVLVVGMIFHTLGELYSSGASWGIGFGMARDDLQGQYQGAYSLGRSLTGIVAPIIVIATAISLGRLGWVILALAFVGIGSAFPPLVRNFVAHQASLARDVSN
jgi:MFS family permease